MRGAVLFCHGVAYHHGRIYRLWVEVAAVATPETQSEVSGMRQGGAWVLLAAVVGLTGCVPLPVALPPVRAGVAVMGAQKAEPVDDFVLAGMVEVGVFPWQLLFERRERAVDLGLGYRGTFGDVGPSLHGPFIEGALFLNGGDDWLRFGTHVQLQALTQAGVVQLGGAAINLRQSVEIFTFVSDPLDDCDGDGCLLGFAHGERLADLRGHAGHCGHRSSGVDCPGGYAARRPTPAVADREAGAGALNGRGVWQISAGITVRIPAVIGIALVPLF